MFLLSERPRVQGKGNPLALEEELVNQGQRPMILKTASGEDNWKFCSELESAQRKDAAVQWVPRPRGVLLDVTGLPRSGLQFWATAVGMQFFFKNFETQNRSICVSETSLSFCSISVPVLCS